MAKIDKVFNQFLKPINKEIDKKTKNTNIEYKYNKKSLCSYRQRITDSVA